MRSEPPDSSHTGAAGERSLIGGPARYAGGPHELATIDRERRGRLGPVGTPLRLRLLAQTAALSDPRRAA